MITQVSGPKVDGVVKDPRRKAQRIKFKNNSNITYKSSYTPDYEKPQKDALWTSISILLGSLFFATAYFMFTGLKNAKK